MCVHRVDRDTVRAQVATLREALGKAKHEHDSTCRIHRQVVIRTISAIGLHTIRCKCDCGADVHNAAIDAVLEKTK